MRAIATNMTVTLALFGLLWTNSSVSAASLCDSPDPTSYSAEVGEKIVGYVREAWFEKPAPSLLSGNESDESWTSRWSQVQSDADLPDWDQGRERREETLLDEIFETVRTTRIAQQQAEREWRKRAEREQRERTEREQQHEEEHFETSMAPETEPSGNELGNSDSCMESASSGWRGDPKDHLRFHCYQACLPDPHRTASCEILRQYSSEAESLCTYC